jgi:hypothetical protein
VVKAKNRNTTSAAIAAPSSGRRNSFVRKLTWASRSSTTDVGGGAPGGSATVA